LSSFNSTCDNVTFTFPALQNVHKAQGNDGVRDKIKAIAALNADVHESSSNKPPDGNFSNNVKDVMIHTVKFVRQIKVFWPIDGNSAGDLKIIMGEVGWPTDW